MQIYKNTVKGQVQFVVKFKGQVLFSILIEDEDWSTGYNGVPPPCGDLLYIDDYRASDTPLSTIPQSILTTSYQPDIVIHFLAVPTFGFCVL